MKMFIKAGCGSLLGLVSKCISLALLAITCDDFRPKYTLRAPETIVCTQWPTRSWDLTSHVPLHHRHHQLLCWVMCLMLPAFITMAELLLPPHFQPPRHLFCPNASWPLNRLNSRPGTTLIMHSSLGCIRANSTTIQNGFWICSC